MKKYNTIRNVLIVEMVVAVVLCIWVSTVLLSTFTTPQDPNNSFPIEATIVYQSFMIWPYLFVSMYSKLIAKSWQAVNAPAIIIIPLCSVFLSICYLISQSWVGVANFDLSKPIESIAYSVNLIFSENLLVILMWMGVAIISWILFGLYFSFIRYQKTTKVPWINLVHLPGILFIYGLFYLRYSTYNSDKYISLLASNGIRIGFTLIPFGFLGYIIAEYRAWNRLNLK